MFFFLIRSPLDDLGGFSGGCRSLSREVYGCRRGCIFLITKKYEVWKTELCITRYACVKIHFYPITWSFNIFVWRLRFQLLLNWLCSSMVLGYLFSRFKRLGVLDYLLTSPLSFLNFDTDFLKCFFYTVVILCRDVKG